ncbi:hypothetical protein Tco_1443718 [Tanacetum coccineum]
MYVDHMSQPWRTLAAIINKCLFGKTASNDILRKSKIDIMWGMFYRETADYPELIWEDLAYQIDYMKERKLRRKNMPYPRFTKVIINHFLKQHKSLSNLKYQHYHTIKDDGIIPPKKSRGKGLQGKKTVDDSQETVDVSEESEPELEHVKRKTASRRVVKKKVTLSADDNIITDEPGVSLELGKSMSLTEAKEEEAARKVHATYAKIMTESVPESAKKKSGGRSSRGVTIQDTPSFLKPKPATSKPKLKGAQFLTPTEKEAADIMQALKKARRPARDSQVLEAQVKELVLYQGFSMSPQSSLLPHWGPEQESEHSEEDKLDDEEKDDKEGDADDESDDHIIDTQDIDDEDDETESDEDEIYKYKIHVRKDEDEEMLNAEVEDSRKGDAEVSDAAKADAEKTEEAKDDSKKVELPPTSSSLSISSGFGDQFLKLSSDTSLVGTVKDTTDAEISSLLDIKIQSEVPHT